MLDVGQGDAILLEPRDALPVLVDTGPPGGGTAERLEELGIDRLGALALTHDQLDHSGALGEVLARVEAERIVHAPGARPRYCAGGGCPGVRALGAGRSLRVGPPPSRRPLAARRGRERRPQRELARPSRPASAGSRPSSPATPRPRWRRSTRGRWTCSSSPTTAAPMPGCRASCERAAPQARGDLGGGRQLLRAPGAGDAGRPGRRRRARTAHGRRGGGGHRGPGWWLDGWVGCAELSSDKEPDDQRRTEP